MPKPAGDLNMKFGVESLMSGKPVRSTKKWWS
jgi:hypothetical protein